MRDMVEVGWGRNKLGPNISVHICQATLFNFESKSISATVRWKEEEEKSELVGSSRCSQVNKRDRDKGERKGKEKSAGCDDRQVFFNKVYRPYS